MKPHLFIDFYNTLCFDLYWRSMDKEMYEKSQSFLFKENWLLIEEWMRGKYTSEDINLKLAQYLNIPYEDIWEIFVQDCKTLQIDKKILKKISTLRKIYTTILITDNMDNFGRFTLPVLQLSDYFDQIIISSDHKCLKTDNEGELFLKGKNGISDFSNDILIDDSTRICAVFKTLGGTPYQVTPDESLSYWLEKIEEKNRLLMEEHRV